MFATAFATAYVTFSLSVPFIKFKLIFLVLSATHWLQIEIYFQPSFHCLVARSTRVYLLYALYHCETRYSIIMTLTGKSSSRQLQCYKCQSINHTSAQGLHNHERSCRGHNNNGPKSKKKRHIDYITSTSDGKRHDFVKQPISFLLNKRQKKESDDIGPNPADDEEEEDSSENDEYSRRECDEYFEANSKISLPEVIIYVNLGWHFISISACNTHYQSKITIKISANRKLWKWGCRCGHDETRTCTTNVPSTCCQEMLVYVYRCWWINQECLPSWKYMPSKSAVGM